jgi:hypothetical protein
MAEIATLTTRHGTLYRHEDTELMMEDNLGWLTIGPLDGSSIVVSKEEWPAFLEMINAIDAARKAGGSDGPV